jgi:thiamine biosynthesis lipoprotein
MLLSSSAPHRRSTPAACRQLSAVAALALLVSCAQSDSQLRLHTFSGPTMGTQYTVKVVAEDLDDERQDHLGETIQRELDEVNAKMSHYLEDSELSRLNRWQSVEPYPISLETFEVLNQALRISRLTDGAFDITIAPLVDAWGFGPPGRSDEPPNEQLIEMLLRRTGWELIELLPDGPAVRKLVPQLTFDLSAIAKGFGVDQVAEGLEREGVRHYMVEVGGEVRTRGSNPDGTAWRIAIEKPDSAQRALQLIVPLRDLSMATSGDYRNYYEAGGRRISHTIDPRTGRPITHALASVSVIHEECVQADALATALMVLGPEGYELAEQLGLAVYFLAREADGGFIETRTTAFSALVED